MIGLIVVLVIVAVLITITDPLVVFGPDEDWRE